MNTKTVQAIQSEQFSVLHGFSLRECHVFVNLIRGRCRANEIARELKISVHTVNNHLKSLFSKAKCGSKAGLLARYIEFIENPPVQAEVILLPYKQVG